MQICHQRHFDAVPFRERRLIFQNAPSSQPTTQPPEKKLNPTQFAEKLKVALKDADAGNVQTLKKAIIQYFDEGPRPDYDHLGQIKLQIQAVIGDMKGEKAPTLETDEMLLNLAGDSGLFRPADINKLGRGKAEKQSAVLETSANPERAAEWQKIAATLPVNQYTLTMFQDFYTRAANGPENRKEVLSIDAYVRFHARNGGIDDRTLGSVAPRNQAERLEFTKVILQYLGQEKTRGNDATSNRAISMRFDQRSKAMVMSSFDPATKEYVPLPDADPLAYRLTAEQAASNARATAEKRSREVDPNLEVLAKFNRSGRGPAARYEADGRAKGNSIKAEFGMNNSRTQFTASSPEIEAAQNRRLVGTSGSAQEKVRNDFQLNKFRRGENMALREKMKGAERTDLADLASKMSGTVYRQTQKGSVSVLERTDDDPEKNGKIWVEVHTEERSDGVPQRVFRIVDDRNPLEGRKMYAVGTSREVVNLLNEFERKSIPELLKNVLKSFQKANTLSDSEYLAIFQAFPKESNSAQDVINAFQRNFKIQLSEIDQKRMEAVFEGLQAAEGDPTKMNSDVVDRLLIDFMISVEKKISEKNVTKTNVAPKAQTPAEKIPVASAPSTQAPERTEIERRPLHVVDDPKEYARIESRQLIIAYRPGKRDDALAIGQKLGLKMVREGVRTKSFTFQWEKDKPITQAMLDSLKQQQTVLRIVEPSYPITIDSKSNRPSEARVATSSGASQIPLAAPSAPTSDSVAPNAAEKRPPAVPVPEPAGEVSPTPQKRENKSKAMDDAAKIIKDREVAQRKEEEEKVEEEKKRKENIEKAPPDIRAFLEDQESKVSYENGVIQGNVSVNKIEIPKGIRKIEGNLSTFRATKASGPDLHEVTGSLNLSGVENLLPKLEIVGGTITAIGVDLTALPASLKSAKNMYIANCANLKKITGNQLKIEEDVHIDHNPDLQEISGLVVGKDLHFPSIPYASKQKVKLENTHIHGDLLFAYSNDIVFGENVEVDGKIKFDLLISDNGTPEHAFAIVKDINIPENLIDKVDVPEATKKMIREHRKKEATKARAPEAEKKDATIDDDIKKALDSLKE